MRLILRQRRDFALEIIEPTQATKVINFPRTACTPATHTPPCRHALQSLPPLTSECDIALMQASPELTVGHSPMDFTSVRRKYQLPVRRTTLLTPHQATAPTLEPIVLWAPQGAAAQQGTARGDSAAQRDAFPRVSRTVFRRRHAGGRTGTSV